MQENKHEESCKTKVNFTKNNYIMQYFTEHKAYLECRGMMKLSKLNPWNQKGGREQTKMSSPKT